MRSRHAPFLVLLFLLALACSALTAASGRSAADPPATERSVARDLQRDLNDLDQLSSRSRSALFRAQQLADQGEFTQAAATLHDYLNDNPQSDHHLLRFHLGHHWQQAGEPAAALAQFQATLNVAPRHAAAWLGLAETAYELGEYSRSAAAFAEAFAWHPEQPVTLLYYAAASHLLADQPAAALPLLRDLLSGQHGPPQLDWYRALVAAGLDLEQPEHMKPYLAEMLTAFGDQDETWYLAYQYHAGSGNYRQAALALTVMGYLRPLSVGEQRQLGDLLRAIEIPAAAAVQYEQALSTGEGTAREYEQLAAAHLAAFENERARATLKQALEHGPTARLWALLGDVYYSEESFAEAFQAYGASASLDPSQGRSYLMQAYCALEQGLREEAVILLQRASAFPAHRQAAESLLQEIVNGSIP